MVKRDEIVDYLEKELDVEHYNEAGDKHNGVLVEGREDVRRVGLSANCTYETIENAAEENCDLIVSHHGGWEKFDGKLLEEKKQRIRENGMSWFIAHHSLDCADEEYGIAVALAEKLGIDIDGSYGEIEGGEGGKYGSLAVSKDEFFKILEEVEENYETVGELEDIEDSRIGVVGGSGGAFRELIDETAEIGADVMITGNAAFFGKIHAKELGLDMILLEETSSEKWGVYNLGEHLKEQFDELEIVRLEETNW